MLDIEYRKLITEKYFVTSSNVKYHKEIMGFNTYKRLYKHFIFRDKLLEYAKEIFVNIEPFNIKEIYNSKYAGVCACKFVNDLYYDRSEKIVAFKLYERIKKALRLLKKKGLI